jgi:hypothetical protein
MSVEQIEAGIGSLPPAENALLAACDWDETSRVLSERRRLFSAGES